MTENEQIEEMARTLCRYYDDGICDCDKKLCDLECEEFTSAQHLYAKAYRKVERGEWVSGKTITGEWGYSCSVCGAAFTGENAEWIAKEHLYCGKCGADMRGGKEE